jgi:hypothetical protein
MKQEMADDLHFSPTPLSQKQYLSSNFASKKKKKSKFAATIIMKQA